MTDDAATTELPAAPIDGGVPVGQDQSPLQLTQARAPLDDAGEVLGTIDAAGKQPIVVVPLHASRIRTELVIAGLGLLAVTLVIDVGTQLRVVLGVLSLVLLGLGFVRALLVPVPEG